MDQSKPVVAIGKHLCGAGFDFGIRCCSPWFPSTASSTSEDTKHPLVAIVVALCCHHRCMWKAYPSMTFSFRLVCVNLTALLTYNLEDKDFLKKIEVSKEEFQLMCSISSWAICAIPKKNNQSEQPEGEHDIPVDKHSDKQARFLKEMDVKRKEELGYMCKRILDVGRVLYLRDNGFDSKLVYYIGSDVSPENALLIATLKG